MRPFLLRRVLSLIPTFLGITLVSFFIMHLATGKPTDIMTDLNVKISLEAREKLSELYGLDQPIPIQYVRWLGRTLRGDFGRSFSDQRPVLDKIAEAVPITLGINALALLLILMLAVPLGVFSAAREGSALDTAGTWAVFIGFALPSFWVSLLALDLLGVRLGWLPVSGLSSLEADRMSALPWLLDRARHLILPVSVAVLGGLAGISRYVRSNMLQVLNQEYIRTARAKGLPERIVLFRHALRNALLPLITILGLSIPGLIGGSVIMESIFAIPGMGRLFFGAVMGRDHPVIMGILVFGALLTLLGNLLADLAYAYADPRIRVGSSP